MVKKSQIPRAILRAFTTGLGGFLNAGNPLWTLLQGKYVAHESYNLNLSAISETATNPDQLADALLTNTGWRFLAAEGGRFAACHVGSTMPGLPPKITGVSTELPVLQVVERIAQLERLKQVATREFEVRMLRTPWLRFEAFWLVAADGGPDLVVPYAGFIEGPPNNLELMKPYTAADFLAKIWPRAQELRTSTLAKQTQDFAAAGTAARAQANILQAVATAAKKVADEIERAATAAQGVAEAPAAGAVAQKHRAPAKPKKAAPKKKP